MKHATKQIVMVLAILSTSTFLLERQNVSIDDDAVDAQAVLKAFPTAEGFGAISIGGRGGRVIPVTNLDDTGPGSLRSCAEASGPRLCVFRVSGTIELASQIVIREASSYLTIAGQTSPGGVQLKGYGIAITDGGHDVIVRYLRIRPGTHLPALTDTNGFYVWGVDGAGTTRKRAYNIVADHLSLQWATDQNGPDATGWVEHMTAQYNLISEGTTVGHSGGDTHNMGLLISGKEITYSGHHNVIAHIGGRAPLVGASRVVDWRNNLIYNWGGNNGGVFGGWHADTPGGSSFFGNVVNNHYLAGPNSGLPYFWVENGGPTRIDGSQAERGGTKLYTRGNRGPNCPVGCADDWNNDYQQLDYWSSRLDVNKFPKAAQATFRTLTEYVAGPIPVTTDPSSQLKAKILSTVGASRCGAGLCRDAVDARIVADLINCSNGSLSGCTGSTQNIGGGPWPMLAGPAAPTDADNDGMPNAWESSHALNPNSAADGPAFATNGYTNVENYLNQLAGDTVPGQ